MECINFYKLKINNITMRFTPQKGIFNLAGHLRSQLVQGFLEPKHKVTVKLTDYTKQFIETSAKM